MIKIFDSFLILSAIPLSMMANLMWACHIRPQWLSSLNNNAEQFEQGLLGPPNLRAW